VTAGGRLGLLFGGRSVEHEVSVVSARGVAAALLETSFVTVPLAVTAEGRWLSPALSQQILAGDAARVEPAAEADDGVSVLLDPGGRGLLLHQPAKPAQPLDLDVIFPLIHGWGGEDGRLQGALELAAVPYVGAGVLGSAAGMDKATAKRLFESCGLPVTPWVQFSREDRGERRILAEIGLPLFIKPANGGSSVGITRVARESDLRAAIDEALACDSKGLAERALDAREIECAVLGNAQAQASVLGEVIPAREFYDYTAKYIDNSSELKIPAVLDGPQAARMRQLAIEAYQALDLCGFARVDFLMERATGLIFLNEVNTLPGFTPISMFPKLWAASGLAYPQLIARLVDLGRERWLEARRLRTRWKPA
jgi:D-alanine-D-alanine ligase